MTPVFIYLIKAALINALMLGVYYYAIRPGRNFSLMRATLLATIVLPLLLPLIPQPVIHQGDTAIPVYVITLPEPSGMVTIQAGSETAPAPLPPLHEIIYYAVSVILLLSAMIAVLSVLQKLRKANVRITAYGKIYIDDKATSPFSFFRWVFFPGSSLELPGTELLLRHEFSHVRRRHSIDRMISALFRSFFWFSPFAHLSHKLLAEVNEYQADADAIQVSGDKEGYNNLMIEFAGIYKNNPISHPFSAHLKKRIIMLNHLKPGKLNLTAIVTGMMLVAAFAILSAMIQPGTSSTETIGPEQNIQDLPETANTLYANIEQTHGQAGAAEDTTLKEAAYPGGEAAKLKFLQQNIRYPAEARKNNIQGTVLCRFTVETDGKVTSPEIIRGIGSGCDEEVIRVVALMPRWQPAEKNGKPVRSSMVMPVKFALSGDSDDAVSEEVFMVVENPPQFPGGDEARAKYFSSAIQYPEDVKKENIEGTVYVTFVIEKNGSISNAKVIRGVDPRLDKIALDAVNAMPAWTPGTQRGKTVRVQFNIPVKFSLKSESAKPREVKTTSQLPDGREVYNVVDETPEFPGGMEKLAEFISANTKYTETAKKEKIEGTVYVSFVIEADGSVSNAQVLRGIGGGLDDVAREAVMKMPGWKPGKKDGVAVPVRFNMPVKFKLDPSAPDKPMELPEKIVYQGREVYYKAEQMPEYPGGNDALLKYFRNYISNLEFDSEHGKSTIYVSFIVEPDGSITPAGIAGSPEVTVSDKFTEAIGKMKNWKPGKTRGAVVPVKLNYFFSINK